MNPIPEKVNMKEKYDPAMEVNTIEEAANYLELCIDHSIKCNPMNRHKAMTTELSNIAYWAGYFSHATRVRVESLYGCFHPMLGSAAETGPLAPEDCIKIGKNWAKEKTREKEIQGYDHPFGYDG